jgi:hypothetical protein
MNTWTPDRPTKPGKYWLSVHPEIRTSNGMRIPHTLLVEVDSGGSVEAEGCSDWSHLLDPLLDGALWHPYVEPPDPFAEPVPSLRERVEALPDLVLGSGRVIGSAVDRGAVLALLETESQ